MNGSMIGAVIIVLAIIFVIAKIAPKDITRDYEPEPDYIDGEFYEVGKFIEKNTLD